MRWITAGLGVTVLVMVLTGWTAQVIRPVDGSESIAIRPAGLTQQGRLLWNLEALLTQTVGSQRVCVSAKNSPRTLWNFTSGDCAPLAKYSMYSFVFEHPRGSRFHRSSTRYRSVFFGNYPEPVLLRGRLIVCDTHARRFLIDYVTGPGLTLGCLAAQTS